MADRGDSIHVESLARMLEHLREPLLIVSTAGRILAANVASADALGTSVVALRGAALEAHASEPARVAEAMRAAPRVRQFPLRARDGRRFTCDASLLDPDVLLLRLSGGPSPEPRERAFFDALSRFDGLQAQDDHGLDEVAREPLTECIDSFGALAGGVFVIDDGGANLEMRVAVHYPEGLADRYRLIPLSARLPVVDTVKTLTPAFLSGLDDYRASYPEFATAHPDIARNAFVALPLVVDGCAIGAILMGFAMPRRFSADERATLLALAEQIGGELTRRQRLDAARAMRRLEERAARRLGHVHAFTGALAQAITLAQVAEVVVDLGMAATAASSGRLWLLGEDGVSLVLVRSVGPSGASAIPVRLPIDSAVRAPVLDALRDGIPIWVESRSQLEERYPEVARLLPVENEGALACFPLFAHGRCIGGLTFGFDDVHRFREDERAFLQVVSWYSAQSIERARLHAGERQAKEQAEANQRRSDFIADLGSRLASSLDYEDILADVARTAVPRFAHWCLIELVDQRIRGTQPVASHADPEMIPLVLELRTHMRQLGAFAHGINETMRTGVARRHPYIPMDAVRQAAGEDGRIVEIARALGVASTIVVAIAARGRVLGAILLNRADPSHPYDEQDLAMAEELGRNVGLALDNARLYQEAREADRLKDEFLAMLSHELRNPLAPILSALELMDLRGDTTFARERGVISRHVRHVVRLVDDLFDLSRITRGKIHLEKRRHELASIIAAAAEMAGPLVEKRSHRLEVASLERELSVMADHARLTQAIANLVTNAAKYTEPGGQIAITAHEEGDDAVVRVRDSGVGIAAEHLPRIFDLFVQATGERAQGGLGIGLTVVKSLVTLHGGTVSAHSAGLGQGSEFVIRLPRAAAEA